MKTLAVALVSLAFAVVSAFGSEVSEPSGAREPRHLTKNMKITIGARVFNGTLEDNESAAAFSALLPLTLDMRDVNENEKAYELPSRLPSADVSVRTIRTGDLMLWSSRTVVVFYKSFPTPYRYTRLGRIENPDGLAAALGGGDVTVKVERR